MGALADTFDLTVLRKFSQHWSEGAPAELLGAALAEWIRISQRDAIRAGVAEVPLWVRQGLTGSVDADVIERTRFRVGRGNQLALPAFVQGLGGARAITLDNVVVFRSIEDVQDLRLWAHELHHVDQFERWGVDEFARRYVRDFEAIEAEAEAAAERFAR